MLFKDELNKRINDRRGKSFLDVNTVLEHFCIVSYKVKVEKVAQYIPLPFKLWSFLEDGIAYTLISAVLFKDKDFSFYKITSSVQFEFFQTNYRTYIIDQRDGSYSSWFFGTTLGSITCLIPKYLWKMPWEVGKYTFNFQLEKGIYYKYNMKVVSKQGNINLELTSETHEMKLLKGFQSIEEQLLILTHPIKGYYTITENKIGEYEIWHPKLALKQGTLHTAYFEFYEKLGMLTSQEMRQPHSVLIVPSIEFDILLPPSLFKP